MGTNGTLCNCPLRADNASYHATPEVRAWLAERPRLVFHFTPTHASWLAPVVSALEIRDAPHYTPKLEATCGLGGNQHMGLLTFALNVTLDGCCDHREMVANDEMHRYWTRVMDAAGAMLFGRRTYELMEGAWPQVARDPKAPRSDRDWAKKLEAKPKYVVSTTRRDFPWSNTHHVEGDLTRAVKALKKATPRGLLVGSPTLSAALQRLDLVDEYRFVVHPVVAGHGPFLFSGLRPSLRLKFVAATRLKSGIVALHYRRR